MGSTNKLKHNHGHYQYCHSVMKKNPRIYLEKNPEHNKKNRHTNCSKKVKIKLEIYATTSTSTWKTEVICVVWVACKRRSSVGAIVLADLWWRNRSGKKLSCKRKMGTNAKEKMFSHCSWICASRKHEMYGSLPYWKNLYFHNCWNLSFVLEPLWNSDKEKLLNFRIDFFDRSVVSPFAIKLFLLLFTSHCSMQNIGFNDSGYVIKSLQTSSAIYGAPPFRDDHYPVCWLDIRQDSEFTTGYGYPKTAFKREPDTDPVIRNAFIDVSRIQSFGKSCTLHNDSFIVFT